MSHKGSSNFQSLFDSKTIMDPRRAFEVVVACDAERGIGIDNKLPWSLPADMKHFRTLTSTKSAHSHENFVIMGKNTWFSLPAKFRPLPNRRNIVLSKTLGMPDLMPGIPSCSSSFSLVCQSLDDALKVYAAQKTDERCFVIGGARVYEEALVHPCCSRLHLTQISAKFKCDAFFPPFENTFSLLEESEVQEENGISFSFKVYERKA
jgi:dihydrofolate reductase